MKVYQHSIDCLQLYGYQGEPIEDVIAELKALQQAAKKRKMKNIRVRIAPRTNWAQIDEMVRLDLTHPICPSKLRLFVTTKSE